MKIFLSGIQITWEHNKQRELWLTAHYTWSYYRKLSRNQMFTEIGVTKKDAAKIRSGIKGRRVVLFTFVHV